MEKQKKNKPICCPVCGRKYYDTGMGAARLVRIFPFHAVVC